MSSKYRSKRGQEGEAEMMFFGIVLVICGIISGSLLLLNWIKDTKDDRVRRARDGALAKLTPTPHNARPDPAAYLVHCDKPGWAFLQTKFDCDVMPESYGGLYLLPDPSDDAS